MKHLLLLLIAAPIFVGQEAAGPIPETLSAQIRQVVLVEEDAPGSTTAKLSAWQRGSDGWEPVIRNFPAVVGRNGLSQPGQKREGDGRTPAGIFPLGTAFGYEEAIRTHLAYRRTTADDFWVDDPQSPDYNRWVKGPVKAESFERLRRDDDLYKYGVVIEYNTNPVVRGKGSAIFLHVWRSPRSPTAGCVALNEKSLLKLLRWLDRSQNPVIIIGKPDADLSRLDR